MQRIAARNTRRVILGTVIELQYFYLGNLGRGGGAGAGARGVLRRSSQRRAKEILQSTAYWRDDSSIQSPCNTVNTSIPSNIVPIPHATLPYTPSTWCVNKRMWSNSTNCLTSSKLWFNTTNCRGMNSDKLLKDVYSESWWCWAEMQRRPSFQPGFASTSTESTMQ